MAEEATERPDDGQGPRQDGDAGDEATAPRPDAGAPLPISQLVGRAVIVGLALLFVIFAVSNRQPVDFSWIVGGTEVVEQGGDRVGGGVPLIVLLIGSFVLGGVVTAGLLWRRRRVRRGRPEDR